MIVRLESGRDLIHCDLDWARYPWMMEEYRISRFAQELDTATVSAVRLDQMPHLPTVND